MNIGQLFRHLPESLIVITPDYKIVDATDLYLATTMRKREDLVGLHFLKEAFPEPGIPYENNPVKHALDEVKATHKPVTLPVIKYAIAKPEPGQFEAKYWETTHTPIFDDSGELVYLVQTARDVTERELARLSQIESEQKFRFIADSLPQLIDTNDAEGNLTYFNKRWTDYTGIPEAELIKDGWSRNIHPNDLEKANQAWDNAFENGEPCEVQLRLKSKEGEYRWFVNSYLPMRNTDGTIVLWLCSFTDIHNTKLMVDELLENNIQMAALSDQVENAYKIAENGRQTLLRLIEKAPVAFCILKGPNHIFDLINRQYQAFFPGRQLLNKPVAEALPEVVEQGFIDLLDNVYNTGKEFVAEEVPIKLAYTEGGPLADRSFTLIYQAMLDEKGSVNGILVTATEVTELVKLRKQLTEGL